MAKPYLTSNDLIATIKRKISFPLSQATFSEDDLLAFANDEMRDSMIPNVMKYHQEFFVASQSVDLVNNVSAYPIPNRAIGMKLRDVVYADNQVTQAQPYGNLYEMTRINADDKAFFDSSAISSQTLYKFYIENNNVVVLPSISQPPTGKLVFYYFFRPNQLVVDSRAHIVTNFSKTLTVTNSNIAPGDTITFTRIVQPSISTQTVLTAVAGPSSTNQFTIGGTSTVTATNITMAINNAGIAFTATNGNPATNIIKVSYLDRQNTIVSSNSSGILVQATLGLDGAVAVPINITNGSYVDALQTLPGHKVLNYDMIVPSNGVSGSTLNLTESTVPVNFVVGDYICSRNESIIPQLPPELHSNLAQRVCARILEAIGDEQGLSLTSNKLNDLDLKEGMLIDNRVEGAPLKVLNKHSILRHMSFFGKRRY